MSRIEATYDALCPASRRILACLGQAAFVWDIATDTIAWSDNAASVFTDIPGETLASGAEFAEADRAVAFDPDARRSVDRRRRAAAKASPTGSNMAYGPATSAPVIWIEETGCWFAGPDGKPARAQGIVRVNNERHARDEQLMRLVAARSA